MTIPACPPHRPQLVETRAAIVLLEAGQAVIDRAVGKHCFQPLDQSAHRPEAKHLGAAGIGRGKAAMVAVPRDPSVSGKRWPVSAAA